MEPLAWLAGHLTLAAAVFGIAAILGGLVGFVARVGVGPDQPVLARVFGWVLIVALATALSFALISIFF